MPDVLKNKLVKLLCFRKVMMEKKVIRGYPLLKVLNDFALEIS